MHYVLTQGNVHFEVDIGSLCFYFKLNINTRGLHIHTTKDCGGYLSSCAPTS